MRPFLKEAEYVIKLGDEGRDRLRVAYSVNYERLAEINAKHDPADSFV